MRKLEKMGFDKDWLTVVKSEFKPKKNGFYEMRITDIKDLSDDPRNGVFIETTTFCDDYDLSVILRYFEGNAYVITDVTDMTVISKGIISANLFDFMEDYTGNSWDIFSAEEINREMQVSKERHESIIESLTRENCELRLEIAKLRLQLKER
jgi:hypothetical protein